jgi:hypothetical protein
MKRLAEIVAKVQAEEPFAILRAGPHCVPLVLRAAVTPTLMPAI